MGQAPNLKARLEKTATTEPDDILASFLEYVGANRFELYQHQEDAILELFACKNVILNTPTGSGKTLVALALQYKCLCQGLRSFYTVPIKALANEKFFSLCQDLGAEQVGLITGDATVNASAPVICCTAEILANLAMREGAKAGVDAVIMDEFHFYSDHSRGVAWQVPLLTLPQARFLLMSATLGDTRFFEKELTELTGTATATVSSQERPVPLTFEYSEIPLQEKVTELVEKKQSPVYLVHFTQLACAQTAQNLLSCNFCSREQKRKIDEFLTDADFRSPYGKELRKLLQNGLGIHHAGLLPKYRLLVEKLARRGLLQVICGTDTLGVGVHVPIRTVMLTQLCKYDGKETKILSVRDFRQICGRAGRRGFDTEGRVVVQAPEHVIENLRLEQKASSGQVKRSKIVKRKPPDRGFVPWDQKTFERLRTSPPETLRSSFQVNPGMILNVLSRREEDGCAALRTLLGKCHESESKKKELRKDAVRLFRSLAEGSIIRIIPLRERMSPAKVEVNVDLQEDFTLTHALGLYLVNTVDLLDRDDPLYVLRLFTLVESILENPDVILRRQVDRLKTELMAQMKEEGLEYEERIARLDGVEYPKPDADFIYGTFNAFCAIHPWISRENIRPKSIAREMFENYSSFADYVKLYQLERSEGQVLRHLSEVCRTMEQTVPPSAKTEEVEEALAFLEETLRGVDSTLLDEWKKLAHPEAISQEEHRAEPAREEPFTQNRTVFLRSLRAQIHEFIKSLAGRDWDTAVGRLAPQPAWSAPMVSEAMQAYESGHERVRLDPPARAAEHTHILEEQKDGARSWIVEQILVDPEELNDWMLQFRVDLDRADAEKRVILELLSIGPVGESVGLESPVPE